MSTINDGGPAFPAIKVVSGDNYNPTKLIHIPGMSLRDHFAGLAMQGFCANPHEQCVHDPVIFAQWAYQQADAMLKAREAK